MTNAAILAVAGILLVAYLIDIASRRFRLPSVVALIAVGMLLRAALDAFGIHFGWVDPVVPIIGTLGLILIVLEGALDLEIRRERMRLIAKAFLSAFLGFAVCAVAFAALLHHMLGLDRYTATLAALPFAVISSAVAIPSASRLAHQAREFVVYESSISDILGVLVFYAWLESGGSFMRFELGLAAGVAASLAVAAVAAAVLYGLLSRLEGHVRFVPLLAGIAFVYAAGKAMHLSPLVVVLGCGLLLNNPRILHRVQLLARLHTPEYDKALAQFKGLVSEVTFAAKSFFFVLLGYWTDPHEMGEPRAWIIGGAMIVTIYLTRFALLLGLRQPAADRLTWIAPRGLITVLLFLGATEAANLGAFPFGTVMLVVLATSVLVVHAARANRADVPTAVRPPESSG